MAQWPITYIENFNAKLESDFYCVILLKKYSGITWLQR